MALAQVRANWLLTKANLKVIKRTSDGLRDLLIRHGVKPTMDSKKDIELARKIMPMPYSYRYLNGLNKT